MTRVERIERLLNELRYEVERGMLEREVDEFIDYQFIVPMSSSLPRGVVLCKFQARPMLHMPWEQDSQRLRAVK